MSQDRDGRRGAVFCVRITDEQRATLEAMQEKASGPRALGPWLLWRALGTTRAGARRYYPSSPVTAVPRRRRIILDLCGGSGAWSAPYKRAGYRVVRVTLPKLDVRTFRAPCGVWGVLAAPPCTEFSLARNGRGGGGGRAPDLALGMECVNACLRIVHQTRPRWWALENPVGRLSLVLGTPRDVFEPCDFGDPWTKRTALWGDFAIPKRGPYVRPVAGKTRIERDAGARAVTPAGFARAFFEANQ